MTIIVLILLSPWCDKKALKSNMNWPLYSHEQLVAMERMQLMQEVKSKQAKLKVRVHFHNSKVDTHKRRN